MNYEEFYSELQVKEKYIKDSITRQQNIFKSISRNSAKGDLKNLSKDLAAMETLISDQMVYLNNLKEFAESFDAQEYMQSGDFAKQMLSYCESMGVDVKGDFPAYEIFPYKVKIDADNQDVYK